MAKTFRLLLAQLNPTVGALAANAALARSAWEQGRAEGADLVVLPEMFLTGYQTQDLVMRPAFLADVAAQLAALAAACADGPALGIGAPDLHRGALHNAWHVLKDGKVAATVRKHHLPNSDVFDERRLYTAADVSGPVRIGPVRIGVPICEDAWHPDVAETLAETGAEILVVPNGSPYARGKHDIRQALMVARTVETGLPLVYLNMVGGQDDQVFDGASFVLNPGGRLAVQMPAFDPCTRIVDFTLTEDGWLAAPGPLDHLPDAWEADYRAMVDSLRRLFPQIGVFARVVGAVGRYRFGAGGYDRRRCAGAGTCIA
jgi:NAD+ synthase